MDEQRVREIVREEIKAAYEAAAREVLIGDIPEVSDSSMVDKAALLAIESYRKNIKLDS